jgi:hypothetical protein
MKYRDLVASCGGVYEQGGGEPREEIRNNEFYNKKCGLT